MVKFRAIPIYGSGTAGLHGRSDLDMTSHHRNDVLSMLENSCSYIVSLSFEYLFEYKVPRLALCCVCVQIDMQR